MTDHLQRRVHPFLTRWTLSIGLAASVLAVVLVPGVQHGNPTTTLAATLDADQAPVVAPLPVGKGTLNQRTFESSILKKSMPYVVYTPPGNYEPGTTFPVLYFLHGLGADCTQWLGLGVAEVADALITSGEIPPMLIVMPSGENGYWMNHRPNGPQYRDYLLNEFMPTIEREYPVDARRVSRAIGGLSAGGHGAMVLAWNNPQLFSVVGAHSPGLRTQPDAFPFFGTGEDYSKRDPITLAQRLNTDFDLWLDTGDGDPWRNRAEVLHNVLQSRGIRHTWKHSSGGHDGSYWKANVREYVRFYGVSLSARRVQQSMLAEFVAAP